MGKKLKSFLQQLDNVTLGMMIFISIAIVIMFGFLISTNRVSELIVDREFVSALVACNSTPVYLLTYEQVNKCIKIKKRQELDRNALYDKNKQIIDNYTVE